MPLYRVGIFTWLPYAVYLSIGKAEAGKIKRETKGQLIYWQGRLLFIHILIVKYQREWCNDLTLVTHAPHKVHS